MHAVHIFQDFLEKKRADIMDKYMQHANNFNFLQTKSARQMALETVLLTKNQIFKLTEKEKINYNCQKGDQKHFMNQ